MIHILEYKSCYFDRNPNILLQYVNMEIIFEKFLLKSDTIKKIIKKGGYSHKEIHRGDKLFTKESICDYLDSIDNLSVLFYNIDIFETSTINGQEYINFLAKKYPNIKFILLTDETFLSYNFELHQNKNVFYIINSINNPYSLIKNISQLDRVANYYIMNVYMQSNYNTFIRNLLHQTKNLKRTKKYNFFNGIHKPHRLKCYEIIKNNKLLEDGYFSYVDFADFKYDNEQYEDFKNFLGFETTEDYLKYLNTFQIPYLCDTINVDPNVFVAFAIPPQYSLQSYFSITTETYFLENEDAKNVKFSEKSLKGFYGYNIPLIVGQPTSIQYLKDLGFDLFEDIFDLTPKYKKSEIFEQFDNNLKVIKNMSIEEMHNFYDKNILRIENNFEVLTQRLIQYDMYNFNKFIDAK